VVPISSMDHFLWLAYLFMMCHWLLSHIECLCQQKYDCYDVLLIFKIKRSKLYFFKIKGKHKCSLFFLFLFNKKIYSKYVPPKDTWEEMVHKYHNWNWNCPITTPIYTSCWHRKEDSFALPYWLIIKWRWWIKIDVISLI
jgi:hypothetical protein